MRQARMRNSAGVVVVVLALTAALAACGGSGSERSVGAASSTADRAATSTSESAKATTTAATTTAPPITTTAPPPSLTASQTFTYQGDSVSFEYVAEPPVASMDPLDGECTDRNGSSGASEDLGYMAVPFTIRYKLESDNNTPVELDAGLLANNAPLETDPEAASYDSPLMKPAVEFEFSDGSRSCEYGEFGFTATIAAGQQHEISGRIIFLGSVDRYHPDGEPRHVADTILAFTGGLGKANPALDGVVLEGGSVTGTLGQYPCDEVAVGGGPYDHPIKPGTFFRSGGELSPWCG